MFSSGPSYNKLKTNLRLCVNRLKLLEKKKTELALKQRKEIADYIAAGKVERAKIRVEHIIREDYLVEAMEVVEMYCDLLLARFGLIKEMKTLDDGLSEAISSIIWVTPRLQSDVPELKVVSDQFAAKYGKPYALGCKENSVGTVSEKLVHKLSVQAPPKLTVEKYLIEIAKYYNVEYEPDPQVMQGDETYAADSLIDVGPAPPLPDKSEFGLGPPGGGGGSFPPQGAPFNYPSHTQPQQPGAYPNGAAGASSAPFSYPGGAIGGAPSNYPPVINNSEKSLLGFDEGPPPYFPPDIKTPPGASFTAAPGGANLSNSNIAQNDLNNPSGGEQPKGANASNDVGSNSGGLDLPELPGVPVDTPVHERSSSPPNTKKDDEEDIDFDDLTRRFEALKKKK